MVVPNKFPGVLSFDDLNQKDGKSREYGCECFFYVFASWLANLRVTSSVTLL
jgi:hypothetical protein